MQCEFETLVRSSRGGMSLFTRCPRRATWAINDDRTTMTRLCPTHKGLVNRRLKAQGDKPLAARAA